MKIERVYFMQKNICCKFSPTQLAALSALIMLIGDFIAFIAAILVLQEEQNDNENKKEQQKGNCMLHHEICQLQNQLDCIKQKLR